MSIKKLCLNFWTHHNRQAYYLIAALLIGAFGAITFNMVWSGLLPMNPVLSRIYTISLILMLLIIAFGMADKVIILNNEKNRVLQLENECSALKYKVLQDRTSPHFLFNALATLKAILKKDMALAERGIISLSEIYRFLCDTSSLNLVSLEQELSFSISYLEFAKISFQSNLTFEIVTEGNYKTIMVPPASVQSFVGNSIKHGIAKHGGKAKVVLKIINKKKLTTIEIIDDGPGIQDDYYSRTIHGKISLFRHYYPNCSVSLKNRDTQGLHVCIKIPDKSFK